ncbi:MAG: energy transducer TonB [Myxococcota bacterium]
MFGLLLLGACAKHPSPSCSGDGIATWDEIQVKVPATVRPEDYPEAARGLPDTRCVVRMHVDERGEPTKVEPRACPEVFVSAATAVAMRYRFYPLKCDGVAKEARFDLAVDFRAAGD